MSSIAYLGRAVCLKLRAAARETRGAVAIYVTMLLPMLIGGALLTVDAGRLYSLNTFMQAGADAFALAAAAELDGQTQPNADDSISRANRAIANMVTNKMRLGDAGRANITVASATYLSNLPASDASAIGTANVTTNPALAKYVRVQVNAANFTTIFPATFLGAVSNRTSTSAIATAGGPLAGGGRQLCLGPVVPMFICNPYENADVSIYEAMSDPAKLRRQIILQGAPNSGSYYPGNYGWLDTPELGTGANALRDALALVQPVSNGDCRVRRASVSQRTGNVDNADKAINTRFDLWEGPFNNGKNNSSYAPAQNVRKGWKPASKGNAACNADNSNVEPAASPNLNNKLGRDTAFPHQGGKMGNGTWDFDRYWANNYGTAAPNGWSNSNLPSRHQVYEYELANSLTPTAAVGGNAAGEKGSPLCYSGGTVPNYDRRVMYVALINCSTLSINGNSSDLGVPFGYGKFFLTEPVPPSTDPTYPNTIFAELFGITGTGTTLEVGGSDGSGGSSAAVNETVQLYR